MKCLKAQRARSPSSPAALFWRRARSCSSAGASTSADAMHVSSPRIAAWPNERMIAKTITRCNTFVTTRVTLAAISQRFRMNCTQEHVAVGFMPAFKFQQRNSLCFLERGHKARGYVRA